MPRFHLPSPIRYPDTPIISLRLPDEAALWDCGTLYAYFPDHITFQSDRFRVTVTGGGLSLCAMSESEVLIRGKIDGVTCEEVKANS